MDPIRVVVVDDSALVRAMLAAIINAETGMRCVGTASDPLVAREMIRELNPDVITLDVEMPRMDGLEFLARLMRLRPMPVLMVSTRTEHATATTLRALELGAVDFVAKPRIGTGAGLQAMAEEIRDKIRTAAHARVRRLAAPSGALPGAPGTGRNTVAARAPLPRLSTEKIVFIGASTGGTEALREMLSALPADAPALLIAQHMPAGFTSGFAVRLDSLCRIRVKEARHGERVLAGHAYIAPGGLHLRVERSGSEYRIVVEDTEPVNRHKPSVDVLFRSAAQVVGPNALGIMLTGMGSDGADAMRAMKDAGSYNYVQDEASCVVYGMPRVAVERGAAHEVLPLNRIAEALLLRLSGGARPRA